MSKNQITRTIAVSFMVLVMLLANLGLMAVATIPSIDEPEPAGSRASSRTACPSSAAGWTIAAGTYSYTGACTISGGQISVSVGADVTFEKVTLTHTGTYYLYIYGTLRILNSTIMGASNWYGIIGQASAPLVKIENSTIKNYYSYGTRVYTGSRAEIGNSTFNPQTTSSYGMYIYSATSGYITHNLIKNSSSQGMYVYQSSNVVIDNNTVTQAAGTYGVQLNAYGGRFDNNTVIGGGTANIRIATTSPSSFWDNKAKGNAGSRLFLYSATVSAYRCNFTNASGVDVQTAQTAKLKAYDTYFKTATVATGTSVEVYWKANVSVKWLSTGQPVAGASVSITDVKGVVDPENRVTDAQGKVRNFYLMEYSKDGTTMTPRSPYWVNATVYSGSKDYYNWSTQNLTNGTNNYDLILDDIAPPLTITSPDDGLFTNQSIVTISGVTERNISKEWPLKLEMILGSTVYRPVIGPDGIFSQDVNLPTDAKHNIQINAYDSVLNKNGLVLTVTRDTVKPTLSVSNPADGTLTNITTIDVLGTTEPSANLSINNVTVTLKPDGSFAYVYSLAEGDNSISVRSEDKAKNSNTIVCNVKMDSKAPPLIVAEPKDGTWTNQPSIKVSGSTEPKAKITLNGGPVLLFGSNFQMSVQLNEGDNEIWVKSCDAAENCNQTVIHVTLDTIPPDFDVITPTDSFLTNNASIEVKGTADADSKVNVNDHDLDLTDNEFTCKVVLREGKNSITITATDPVGNKATRTLMVYLDSSPPAITINEPNNGDTFSDASLQIEGTTERDAVVLVNGLKVTNSQGSFITKVTLKEGENTINVSAQDLAGNTATASIKVNLDTKVSLQINGIAQGTTVETTNLTYNFTGKTDSDATIYVNDLPVTVRKDGSFRSEVPLNLGENTITVIAEDSLGNKVTYEYKIVRKEPPPPPPPTIIPTGDGLGAMLIPLLAIVLLLAAVGIGAGLFVRSRKKAKAQEVQTQVSAPAPAAAPVQPVAQVASPQPPPLPQMTQDQYQYQQQTYPAQDQYQQQTYSGSEYASPAPMATATAASYSSEDAGTLMGEAEASISEAEARGEDVTRRRTHLRVAQSFYNKGNSDKAILYSKKALGRE